MRSGSGEDLSYVQIDIQSQDDLDLAGVIDVDVDVGDVSHEGGSLVSSSPALDQDDDDDDDQDDDDDDNTAISNPVTTAAVTTSAATVAAEVASAAVSKSIKSLS